MELAEFIPRVPSRDGTDASDVDARREGQPKPNIDLQLLNFQAGRRVREQKYVRESHRPLLRVSKAYAMIEPPLATTPVFCNARSILFPIT